MNKVVKSAKGRDRKDLLIKTKSLQGPKAAKGWVYVLIEETDSGVESSLTSPAEEKVCVYETLRNNKAARQEKKVNFVDSSTHEATKGWANITINSPVSRNPSHKTKMKLTRVTKQKKRQKGSTNS